MARCVRVPKRDGERARRELHDAGLLDESYRIGADGDSLLIPVSGDVPGRPTEEAELRPQDRPVGDYRRLAEVPEEVRGRLPSSFDVVGDVGMVKLPDDVLPFRREVGLAMLAANRSLRCVFLDSGVKGDLRVRDLELMAGEGPSETVCREFGARIRTDPAKVYYNPRLAGERHRVATLVRDGETVIDMFGGVAPFGTQICRTARPKAVYSVDLNPEAERFALINRRDNGADALVPITGDANDVVPRLPFADRIIMNLPQTADAFLPLALSRLNRGGTVHMYKIIERGELPSLIGSMESRALADGHRIETSHFELKTYSPTMSVYSLDVRLLREEAPRLVRLDHADRLQVRVHGDRADEAHPAPPQLPGQGVGERAGPQAALVDRPSAAEAPQPVREAPALLPDLQEHAGVGDRRLDLPPVPDDPGVRHESLHVVLPVGGDLHGVEAAVRLAERLPLVQDALPRQPGLEALQEEHLEQPPVVPDGDPPLRVVVLDVPRVRRVRPAAPPPPVRPLRGHPFLTGSRVIPDCPW